MSLELKYYVYDVFTTTQFRGNPVAIVHIPPSASLTREQKQLITKEFNFSETTFVHEDSETRSRSIYPTDIFSPYREIPFAGHPTVGTGFHLLSGHPDSEITLRIKAGDTLVKRVEGGGAVHLKVPVDFKVHPSLKVDNLLSYQAGLDPANDVKVKHSENVPIASIVKGMNFFLLELNSVDALGRMNRYPEVITVPTAHLGEWAGLASLGETSVMITYAYTVLAEDTSTTKIRSRMFSCAGFEDPATGSAASTLGAYLALKKGKGRWRFEITQGVEMGRKSDIVVVADIGDGNAVNSVQLQGSAIKVMEGMLTVAA
ncbi:hypothetical protein V5O48_014069 [Marasmius crinis-equi]|uniref:Uncharacterized protein n=1 Tax=Marasmius crinis-equi TaxID=585013 RepID=A0ABR3EYB9_9AGAR